MEAEKIISLDVEQFDDRLKSWNELKKKACKENNLENRIRLITNWWYKYPYKNKSFVVEKYNIPENVWEILSLYKINRIQLVYGIYFTIKLTTNNFNKLALSAIQFNDNGHYDIGILVDDLLICNGIYNVNDINFKEVKKWEIC